MHALSTVSQIHQVVRLVNSANMRTYPLFYIASILTDAIVYYAYTISYWAICIAITIGYVSIVTGYLLIVSIIISSLCYIAIIAIIG